MQSKIRNRVIIILIVTIVGLVIVFKPHHKPGVKDFTSWSQIKQNLSENIHLGLDLRGGSHLVLAVQTDDVIRKGAEQNAEVARTKLAEKNLPVTDVRVEGLSTVIVAVPEPSRNGDIVRELENNFGVAEWAVSDRGSTIVATMDQTAATQLRKQATEQAKQIIENRVNAFGVAEPLVATQGGEGTYQILVQMPGVDDPERVKNTLNADSNLEIRLQAKDTATYPTREAAEAGARTLPGGPAQYEVFPYRERT